MSLARNKKIQTIDIVCRNAFPRDEEVLIKEKGEPDLKFFSNDPQLVEVVKARVAISLKSGRTEKVIINNKTKGDCKLTLSKFAETAERREKMSKL